MTQRTEFLGLAIGGRKSSGKDTVVDHFAMTRNDVEVVRCKQPIVDEYLRLRNKDLGDLTGYPLPPRDTSRPDNDYIKSRDDGDLIWFSSNVIRDPKIGNPRICSEYLEKEIPRVIDAGKIPVVPDMRRHDENNTLFRDLAKAGYPLLCMKLEASFETLMRRTELRDGHLNNWHPDDPTEAEVDELSYHYLVTNDRDELRPLVHQLETILPRYKRLKRTTRITHPGIHVRIVDPTDPFFWNTGGTIADHRYEVDGQVLVSLDEKPRGVVLQVASFIPTQLAPCDGGCLT